MAHLLEGFRNLYEKGLYSDHQIILKDVKQKIPLNIHKAVLIISSPYFEKTWSFGDKIVENPLEIIVEDAYIAQKVLEEFYGKDHGLVTTHDVLIYMILRDFFALSNDYKQLLNLTYDVDDHPLLFQVLFHLTPNIEMARLLNKIFFIQEKVTIDSIKSLGESGLEISNQMAKLMIKHDLRYEVLMANNKSFTIWNTHQDKNIITEINVIYSIVYSSIKNIIAFNGYNGGNITLDIWCTNPPHFLKNFSVNYYDANIITISPDGTKIITCCDFNKLMVWDIIDINNIQKQIFQVFDNGRNFIKTITYSPNGKFILVELKADRMYIFDAITLLGVKTIYCGNINRQARLFSPDDQYFTYSDEDFFTSISLKTFEQVWSIKILDITKTDYIKIESSCYSPDGQKIITINNDNRAKIWDTSNGKILHVFKMPYCGRIIWPDSKCIFMANFYHIYILDANTYEILRIEKPKDTIHYIFVKPF